MTDWFVAYTTSGGERLAKEDLEKAGIEVFLPIEVVTLRPARHRKDRTKRVVSRPLFPRYLFVGFKRGWHDFAGARRSKRVIDFIRDAYDLPVRIEDKIIEGISTAMTQGRYGDAAERAAREAKRIQEEAVIAEQRKRDKEACASGRIRKGDTFTVAEGLFQGFMATVMEVLDGKVRYEISGDGTTLRLDAPLSKAEQIGLLSATQGRQQKQRAS